MRLFGFYERDKHVIRVEYCAGNLRYSAPGKDKDRFEDGQVLGFEPFRGPKDVLAASARKVRPWLT